LKDGLPWPCDIVGEAMDEHFRIAHAFGANEERRQYISAFAE
jgi:hypothetical protein